ncbi:Endocytosis regulator [Sporothrix curviconia]|uniref:Endocytosis regulator n=1 Tax=Sporothrix curviconia TaxID=1260050 RepID=A0ABP0BRN8_9PEZI
MPHRVSNFLRNPSASLEAQVANLKKATVRRPSPKPRSSTSSTSSSIRGHPNGHRTFSYASSLGDDSDDLSPPPFSAEPHNPHRRENNNSSSNSAMKTMTSLQRTSSAEKHEAEQASGHHRISFGPLHFGRTSRESHIGNILHHQNLSLDWKIESPPIVLHGDAQNSTGALVSGLLFLTVRDEPVQLESFAATLNIHTTQKRPYTAHCHDCIHQYTELQKWAFIQGPLTLTKGEHGFPFSVLLAGHLPASMDGPLVSIAYEFHAEAIQKALAPGAVAPAPVKLEKLFDVKRSLPAPELPHHSVRIFPPTNIKASVHFPQVIYPIGQNTLSMRIDGVARPNNKVKTLEFWKLKKLTWRLEETAKSIAPACAKHLPAAPSPAPVEGEDEAAQAKGAQRTDTRVIGEKTLLSGWKSSYAGAEDSYIELELDYMLGKHAKYACDTHTRDGTAVTHQLMIEMVVSQEWAPANKPAMVTQTGVGRILRMHFTDILTQRGGIGVSWDNEAPPIYQDVPPSPPSYNEEILGDQDSISEHIEPLDGVRT